jgi:predicted DNA-binding protein (MmcQ/YjbR family)
MKFLILKIILPYHNPNNKQNNIFFPIIYILVSAWLYDGIVFYWIRIRGFMDAVTMLRGKQNGFSPMYREVVGIMRTRAEAIAFCSTMKDVIEDYPFHDANWALMRHKANKKTYACIYERQGNIWINVKCDTEWRDFFRSAFSSVIPAYHMNKEHWNSIIMDGTVPEGDIQRMIRESYELTKPRKKKQRGLPIAFQIEINDNGG